MRRAVLALTLAAVITLTAGCATPAESSSAGAAPPSAVPTTTTEPVDPHSSAERAFIDAFDRTGLTHPDGDSAILDIGMLHCAIIDAGHGPELLVTPTIDLTHSQALYTAAHTHLCPHLQLPDPDGYGTGVYQVGVDIEPGTYRSPGGENCYWARLGADQSDIIANDLRSGPSMFTVEPSDGFVELNRCTWTLAP